MRAAGPRRALLGTLEPMPTYYSEPEGDEAVPRWGVRRWGLMPMKRTSSSRSIGASGSPPAAASASGVATRDTLR